LNKHIDYSKCCAPIPNDENATSVAFPQDLTISGDGSTLYVAAFGSSEIAVYDTAALENDSFVPDTRQQIPVKGGGPSGVVLDESRNRLYVLTRFDNSLSVIDTESRKEIRHVAMFNPEPKSIVEGRRFLYDASFTSSHGDSACASCHVFGDFDSLAWDLGDPDGDEAPNTGPFVPGSEPEIGFFLLRGAAENPHFRPMKGPMTTQSLRGMDNHGSMHWRGDRTGGNDANGLPNAGPNVQPNGGSFNEDVAFRKFNVAFTGLNGRHAMLSDSDMRKFAKFALQITYPPNPIRNLDNSMTASQQRGADFFLGQIKSDTFQACHGCHVLDRDGNKEYPEVKKPGFFGSDGRFTFELETQFLKVPHLRNLYQKVGMFGMAPMEVSLDPSQPFSFAPLANTGFLGPQIRGFGFLHDGSVDTVFRFISASVFFPRPPGSIPSLDPRTPPSMVPDPGNPGLPPTPEGILLRRDLEAFLLAFDSNMLPVVGQQVTVDGSTRPETDARLTLLMSRADAKECDLVATNRRGAFLYRGDGRFQYGARGSSRMDIEALGALTKRLGSETTYTCLPPGSGKQYTSHQYANYMKRKRKSAS
jgi:YVTN family beta-propeller protein